MGNLCIPEKEDQEQTELGIYCFKKNVIIFWLNNQGTPKFDRDKKYYFKDGDNMSEYISSRKMTSKKSSDYQNGNVHVKIF